MTIINEPGPKYLRLVPGATYNDWNVIQGRDAPEERWGVQAQLSDLGRARALLQEWAALYGSTIVEWRPSHDR